jgi:pilus assembly protein CpaB
LIVMLALVFGLSAAVGVNAVMSGKSGPQVDTVPIVVAAVNIPRGVMITADQVKTRDFPRSLAPPGALSKPAEVVERTVFTPMVQEEPILESKLAPKGSGRGLAALITPGMRAFTIQTTTVAAGVAGFVLPGNKVDVLLTVADQSTDDQTGGGSTTTLLQNVEILAVDQRMEAPADNKVDTKELRSVTLLVAPDQANQLELGQSKGTLHLALRSPNDNRDAHTRPALLSELRYRSGKPWDERAKGVLEALGKLLAQRKPDPPVAPAVAPKPPDPPPPLLIRTLRGHQEGAVMIGQLHEDSNLRRNFSNRQVMPGKLPVIPWKPPVFQLPADLMLGQGR